jgi:ribosomal protein S21
MSKSKGQQAILPGHYAGVKVLGSRKEDLEYALKALKRKIKYSGMIDQLKERKYYEKPSVVKRREAEWAELVYRRREEDKELNAG